MSRCREYNSNMMAMKRKMTLAAFAGEILCALSAMAGVNGNGILSGWAVLALVVSGFTVRAGGQSFARAK